MEYGVLDRILWRLEEGLDTDAIAGELHLPPGRVQYVEKLVDRSRYLRAMPHAPELDKLQ